jgi:hypothetical protein
MVYTNGVYTGDLCDLIITPAPPPGSVTIFTLSGTINPSTGEVIQGQIPLNFHGWTSLEYSGPTVGSIVYDGATIYARPLP